MNADEVLALEEEYRRVYGEDAKIPFPESYPSSTLLGCVDVQGMLSNEEFQQLKKDRPLERIEDSLSAFVFQCRHPKILKVPQKIRSDAFKIWLLQPPIFFFLLFFLFQKVVSTSYGNYHTLCYP